MNQQTRIGKTAGTHPDGRPKARRRRLADSVREVMTVLASATLVTPAPAAEPDNKYSSGPYLQLRSGHDITTEKGYYESTGQGSMYSAIRVRGPNALIHIFDSTLVGLYWHAHALYVTKGGKADAHDSIFRAEALDAAALLADGASIDVERSSVETLGNNGHGVHATGKNGYLRFAGGKIFTHQWGASAGRADNGATLSFDGAAAKEGAREDPRSPQENKTVPVTRGTPVADAPVSLDGVQRTHLNTEGAEAPAVSAAQGSTIIARATDLETQGPNSPVVWLEGGSSGIFHSSTFKAAAGNVPIVTMAEGTAFELHDSVVNTEMREVPVIVALGDGQRVDLSRARLVGRTLISLKPRDGKPGVLAFRVGNKSSAVGDLRTDPGGRLRVEVFGGSRFDGRVNGDADFEIGRGGWVTLTESTRLLSVGLRGNLQLTHDVVPELTLVIERSLRGQDGVLALRTTANRGGALAEQMTDRLLVEGDVKGTVWIDILTNGTGALTDTNSDGVIQADEGISLVQVAGEAAPTSFVLVGRYLAVGPYRYELASFAPGSSDPAQRVVAGTGNTFWDFRLANRLALPPPEPVVVEPPPAPVPGSVVVEPAPTPVPEPVVVEPAPTPMPEPVVVEPAPTPVPEPVVVEPAPTPVPEPVVVEPTPTPVPEPVVVEPAPTPVPEPVVVEPTPTPVPEPVVVEPAPTPMPEPVVVDPPPAPVPEPVVVEPPPAPVPEPVVVEPPPPPAPAPAPVAVKPSTAPTPEPVVVEPQGKVDRPAAGPAGRMPPQLELVPQVAAYVAMPLAASGFLHDALRSWGHPHSKPAGRAHRMSRENSRGFANAYGSRGRYEASGHEHAYRLGFSTRQHGVQFGLPVLRQRMAGGTLQVDLGAGAGDASFAIDVPRSQSHSRMRMAGLGLRVAHAHHAGAYATGLLKIDHLGIDIRTRERNELASLGGLGVSALCEVGGMAVFTGGWTVESSIRASYVDVRLRDFTDADRITVRPQPFRTASAGIASRVSRSFAAGAGVSVRPYVGAGLAYTSGPPSSQQIGRVPFATETMASSWEASAGFEGRFGKSARLLVDVAVQDGLDHGFSSLFATGSVQWIF
jgi:hypothetical protein